MRGVASLTRESSAEALGMTPREAKAADAMGLTPGEFKLQEQIMAERSERFQAINALWDKVGELDIEVRRGRSSSPTSARGEESPVVATSEVRQELAQLVVRSRTSHEALSTSIAEMRRSQADQLRRLDELTTKVAGLQQAQSGVCQSSAGSTDLAKQSADVLGTLEGIRKVVSNLQSVVARQEERERQEGTAQLREWVQHTLEALHKHSMKTSRLALNAPRLSEEERLQALKALDAAERGMRAGAWDPALEKRPAASTGYVV